MALQHVLHRLHTRAVAHRWLPLFTAMTRGLLAVGFIIPGMTKVRGQPFAPGIPTTTPIGGFFDAFFQAHAFYAFVGAAQVLAGVLLLFPQTAMLGAVLYLPIILNIFVITVAMHFTGTWLIAGLMLLANVYLLCWDFDRWKTLLPGFAPAAAAGPVRHLGTGMTLLAGAAAALGGVGVGGIGIALLEERSPVRSAAVAVLGGGIALLAMWLHRRRQRIAAHGFVS